MRIAVAILCAAGAAFAQGGSPPGGGTPPGGTTTTTVTYYATYTLNGGTATQSNQSYSASATDTSGVWVTNSGVLTLINPIISTSGNSSSTDNSSFAGLNAGLLVASGSATVTGGTINTTGTGANGAFAYNTGSTLSLTNTTINATGDGGHAIMATGGATLTASNVNMNTTGGSASAVATDRGGGTITVTGGIVNVAGNNSADIYSTGNITVTGATMKSTGAETAVIEGANSITLNNTTLTTTMDKWGVMIYQSMSGDASGTQGTFTMTGGSLTSTGATGPLFYVNNSTGVINLKGVTLSAASGVLVNAAAGAWGTTGSNGGNVILTADGQTLPGDMVADSISTIAATLKNNSTLTGKLTKASLTLDAASLWSVTGNSVLTSLTDTAGISGTSVTNIKGNGYTVTYDSSLSANSYLGGKTYSLAGGGTLAPAAASTAPSTAPAIAAAGVLNAASSVAGVAPAAWISIYGSHLSTAAAAATTADLVNGYLPTTLGGTTVTIDGKSAYLNYVSPTQLNVQAPNSTTTGNVTVTVANASGSSSASVAMQAVMPGLFTASNYVLAARPSDGVIINGTGATAAGYTTVAAARPGDVLEIFATGLGDTTTAVAPGLVWAGAYATTNTPTVSIGATTATVLYSGLIGAGLYQINFTVPSGLAAGTYPVVVTQSGVSSPTTAVLKIVAN
ncbi:MAG: hypothetical protein ABSC05_19085 [Candidatus Solibacter sp.]